MNAIETLTKVREYFSDPSKWNGNIYCTFIKVMGAADHNWTKHVAYPYLNQACQAKGYSTGEVSTFMERKTHQEFLDMLADATLLALNAGER